MEQRADHSDGLMGRLLTVSGAGNVSAVERVRLEKLLQRIRRGYEARPRITLSKTNVDSRQLRQLLHKTLATINELREQWRQIEPATKEEIFRDGWIGKRASRPFHRDEQYDYHEMCPPGLLEKVLDITALSLQCHLEAKAGDHRSSIRKLLVEEFLVFLHAEGLLENELPLNRKMDALFDWVGVEQGRRPKGIAAIARRFKHASDPATKISND